MDVGTLFQRWRSKIHSFAGFYIDELNIELNEFQPIALISLLMKSFKHFVKKYIVSQTHHLIDPLEFAYQASRG